MSTEEVLVNHNTLPAVQLCTRRTRKACSTYVEMAGEERNATVVLGLMSGTSMDGIDVCCPYTRKRLSEVRVCYATLLDFIVKLAVLVQPYLFYGCSFEILGFLTHPYPSGLRVKQELLRVCSVRLINHMPCCVILVNSRYSP